MERTSPGSASRTDRALAVLTVLLCLGPPLVVAFLGIGLPFPLAVLATLLLAAGLAARRLGDVPALPRPLAVRHPAVAALWLALLAVAAAQIVRTSVYMHDASRPQFSVDPGDPFRVEHNCLTAYAEAARFAAEGDVNVYDRSLYRPGDERRLIGPLTVDPFHYPPPFLLLPGAVRAVAGDFFDVRRVWFGVQALVLGWGLLAIAWWIGREQGRFAALAAVAVWAYPQTLWALQMGNFQVTAIPLAIAGLAFGWSRPLPGMALLAYAAAGKIFPSMLVLHVIATRRWRLVAWIAGSGVVLALATAAIYGTDIYRDFLQDELPELASGSAFPQTERTRTVPINQSIYGLTVKARQLGVSALDPASGKRVAQAYALLLAAGAIVAGWRMGRVGQPDPGPERLRLAAMWLAILNLASFAGPFVGGGYGSVGTVWLITLLAAGGGTPFRRWAWLLAGTCVAAVPLFLPSPGATVDPSPFILGLSLAGQVAAIGVNVWAVADRIARPSGRPA